MGKRRADSLMEDASQKYPLGRVSVHHFPPAGRITHGLGDMRRQAVYGDLLQETPTSPITDAYHNLRNPLDERMPNRTQARHKKRQHVLVAPQEKDFDRESCENLQEFGQQMRDFELAMRMQREEEEEAVRQEELRIQQASVRARECAVCGESLDPLDFPAKPPTGQCTHPVQTCTGCLQQWVASQFDCQGQRITCPHSGCACELSYHDMQRAASEDVFAKYDKIATREALGSMNGFAYCLKPGCNSGQINVESGNYMDCASCGYKQCLEHKVRWHRGETCTQYDYRTSGRKARDEERASEAFIKANTKRCPGEDRKAGKKCGWNIEKNNGCDHMTCRKCKHQFCWQCLAPYGEIRRIGNEAHKTDCPYHSDNLAYPH
ncbi:hypothetical protein H2203_007254 [Taxawa tesnikishii (nom. ined.)]|nr:hypothetical protein H2203_007254 [Dothideales sp. JES 119]